MSKVCSEDCFNCKYDDCILEEKDVKPEKELSQEPRNIRRREYWRANAERLNAHKRAYYAENREEINARRRKRTKEKKEQREAADE